MLHAYGLARLGRDAELRYTTDNTPVTTLSLAFHVGRKGDDGKRPTQWIEGTLWGPLAEAIAPYLKKGNGVTVMLEDVRIETFQQRDGKGPGHKMVGRVLTIELGSSGQQSAPAAAPAPAPRPASRSPAPPPGRYGAGASRTGGFDDMDDDIPFVSNCMSFDLAVGPERRMRRYAR